MIDTVSEQRLEQCSGFLASQMGLYFPRERWLDLLRALERMAPTLGLENSAAAIEWLLNTPLDQQRIEIIASYLTVGETYFYREPAVFAALENQILPDLISARRAEGRRQLRIWSAGCCSGEEPYSIAMLLSRLLPDLEQWNITLLATDINPQFLAKARQGEYRDWSFRGTPDWMRNGYFEAGVAGSARVIAHIRRLVHFDYLNLMDDAYPALDNHTNAMDIVFCRNVLMYFQSDAMQAVLEKIRRALIDGGWLVISPTEASARMRALFTPVGFTDAMLYRKDERQPAAQAWPLLDIVTRWTPPPLEVPPAIDARAEPRPLPTVQPAPEPAQTPSTLALAARACANRGQLDEAYRCCTEAIAHDKLNPGLRYLLASILTEQGRHAPAANALKQALYLDQNHVLAHFALGNCYRRQEQMEASSRHFAHARELLAHYAPEHLLPDADGLSAGRLLEIINHQEKR